MRHERVGESLCSARSEGFADTTSEHPTDVRVDDGHVVLVREREHGSCRVRADSRECQQVVETIGNRSTVVLDHRDRRTMEVHSTAVVAEAGPFGDHGSDPGISARRNGREPIEELVPTRCDARCLRLLEHEFGDQHSPRIAGAPPREVGAPPRSPGEERVGVEHGSDQSSTAKTSSP